MDTTTDKNRQDDERARIAAMMQEVYARLWYELSVALAVRGAYVATFTGHSARRANLYRVLERDWPPHGHIVYHFFEERRFVCTCQRNEVRHLPCAHIGATVLYLQAMAQLAQR
jgi:hypothetical protein